MKHIVPFVLIAFVAPLCALADSYSHRESFEQTSPLSAEGTLALKNVNGSVEIRTWDRNEVRITGEKSARSEEELRLIQLTIDTKPERADVEVKLPKRKNGVFGGGDIRASVRFTVTVPATARVDVHTINGGVTVRGVQGKVVAGTINGTVRAENLSGSATLSTVNGGVDAQFASLPEGGDFSAKSVNGGIKLKLPSNASASVEASTTNGGIDCDFPLQVTGKISGKRINGTIGSGSAHLKASTVNGGIRIQKT